MTIDCDVLVVGGGPAGCSAAAAAADEGFDTVLIEEDKEIGKPVECAEGIGSYLIPLLPFDIPEELLEFRIDGMQFHTEDVSVTRRGSLWKGWSINREKWDKWLAEKASKNGARIMKDTKLVSLDLEGKYRVKRAHAETSSETITFDPNYLIAADGTNSVVLEALGVSMEKFKNANIVSYEADCKLRDERLEYVFFGDVAPSGYAYIFPKSENKANIGLGCIDLSESKVRELFEKFIDSEMTKEIIEIRDLYREKSSDAPIHYPDLSWKYGNVFIVGDAANQPIKPFEEGILPSVVCGWALGKNIRRFRKEGSYRQFIDSIFMGIYSESEKISKILESLSSIKYLALFSDFVTADQIEEMTDEYILHLAERWNESYKFRTKEKIISKLYQYVFKVGFNINKIRV